MSNKTTICCFVTLILCIGPLYDISPKGTIPVLQLSDGIVIDESIDIIKWALAQSSLEWYSCNTELQDKMIYHNVFNILTSKNRRIT